MRLGRNLSRRDIVEVCCLSPLHRGGTRGTVESGGCREKVQMMGNQEKIVIYPVRDGKGRVEEKGKVPMRCSFSLTTTRAGVQLRRFEISNWTKPESKILKNSRSIVNTLDGTGGKSIRLVWLPY